MGLRIAFARPAMVQYARYLYNRDESLEESTGSDGSSDSEVETNTLANNVLHRNKLRLVKAKAVKLRLKPEQVKDLLRRIKSHMEQLLVEGCIKLDQEGMHKLARQKLSVQVKSGSWVVDVVIRYETCQHFQELRFDQWSKNYSKKGPALVARELYFDTRKGMNKRSEAVETPKDKDGDEDLFVSDEEDTAKENLRVRYGPVTCLRGLVDIDILEFPL